MWTSWAQKCWCLPCYFSRTHSNAWNIVSVWQIVLEWMDTYITWMKKHTNHMEWHSYRAAFPLNTERLAWRNLILVPARPTWAQTSAESSHISLVSFWVWVLPQTVPKTRVPELGVYLRVIPRNASETNQAGKGRRSTKGKSPLD